MSHASGVQHVVEYAASLNHRWWAPFPWLPDSAKPGRPLADSEEMWRHISGADFDEASVLDFGCHEGYHIFRALHGRASSALGVDKTERVINIARAIEEHIEQSGAEFRVASSLDGLPVVDVALSLSVWHQVDPTYQRLHEHIADLRAIARRAVYLDLIIPPLEGAVDADAIVTKGGGVALWKRRHPVRRDRTLYRLPGGFGG